MIIRIVVIEVDLMIVIPIVVAITARHATLSDQIRHGISSSRNKKKFKNRIGLGSNVMVYVLFIGGSLAYQRAGFYSPPKRSKIKFKKKSNF